MERQRNVEEERKEEEGVLSPEKRKGHEWGRRAMINDVCDSKA